MKLGEFIKQFSHNNIIRLVYKIPGGHEVVLDIWNDVSMDHQVLRQKGRFRHYIDNEVLGLAGIGTEGSYPEAINIVIERLEDQPFLDDLSKNDQAMSMSKSLEN
jgi:hypothetical protein